MSRLLQMYDRSPVFVQHVMATASGFQKNRSRYGKVYWAYRRFLQEFDTWSLERQLEYRNEEMNRFLRYAVSNSPFYADLYTDVDVEGIRTVEDLVALPIVDKEMLRVNMDRVLATPLSGSIEGHTGGTTGKSLVFRMTSSDVQKRMAQLDHFKSKHEFENRKMRRATFMGKHIVPPGSQKPVFWRYNAASRQMLYSSFHLSEDNLGAYVDSLNRYKPVSLDGFFSAMVDIAGYMDRHGFKPAFRPVALFPTSETVTESGRELLERIFDAPVIDQYASSEGAPFVTECKAGVKHIELASGVFEQKSPDTGEILVTSFTTHGTPLIRYDIGDTMEFGDSGGERCVCGSDAPKVMAIGGRQQDYLYTVDGGRINAGVVANLFKGMPNSLVQAQCIQEDVGSITIRLQYDPALYKEEHDNILLDDFRHTFEGTSLTIEHVDEIPKEKSGKSRLIVNRL